STETPAVNQSVTFTSTASGGNGTYYFSSFIPGGSGVVTASLNQISTTRATAGASYPFSGLNTAVFYISDSAGNSANCAKTVTVQAGPTVSLSASPATTVPANQTIAITALASNFSSTPTYSWSISGTGLNLVASGNIAYVTAVDSTITRSGTVTVIASNGSQSATSSTPVTFTAGSTTLNCSISYTPSYAAYTVGQNVPFSITASTGEALTVTQINVTDGYVVGGVPSQYPYINFYYSGSKLVTALARSTSSGVQCNNGAYLQTTIYIAPSQSTFSCTLSMTPNPTTTYTWILATINATGAQGGYWLESLTANSAYMTMDDSSSSDSLYNSSYSSTIYRYVYFTYPGTWKVTARLRDSAGRIATCDTYETIYDYVTY
ncbi:MAG: hypothetical protein ACKODS_05720, partial [Methylophilaceae bacterium]